MVKGYQASPEKEIKGSKLRALRLTYHFSGQGKHQTVINSSSLVLLAGRSLMADWKQAGCLASHYDATWSEKILTPGC